MKKLKDLLKESFVWERQFGEKLPTLIDIQKKHENNVNEEDLNEAKVSVGFSNEMGALYVSDGKTGGKSVELYKADVEAIIKMYKKFKSKMD